MPQGSSLPWHTHPLSLVLSLASTSQQPHGTTIITVQNDGLGFMQLQGDEESAILFSESLNITLYEQTTSDMVLRWYSWSYQRRLFDRWLSYTGYFQNLVDSVPFFEDPDSSASLLQQGLVMMTTDTNALSRPYAATGAMTTMIQPHSPMMLSEILRSNNNPAWHPFRLLYSQRLGQVHMVHIKASSQEVSARPVASITRLDYQLEFDPSSLPVVTVEPTNY